MSNDTLAMILGGFILANGASIAGAVIFSVKHIIRYNLLLIEFNQAKIEIKKLNKDVNEAHNRLREYRK